MKNWKKIVSSMMIFVLCLLVLPFSAFAAGGTVSSVSAAAAEGVVTVSGKTGADVLAVAVLVYDSADNLVVMETGAVDGGSYEVKLSHEFEAGKYTVKAADYAGGEFATTTVTVEEKKEQESTEPTESTEPEESTEPTEIRAETENAKTTEAVTAAVNVAVAAADKGDTVVAEIPKDTTIGKAAIQKAMDKGVSLKVESKAASNVVWVFAKLENAVSFDPEVVVNADIKAVKDEIRKQNLSETAKSVPVHFAHDGVLPGTAKVTLDLAGYGFADAKEVYLYYYNAGTGKFFRLESMMG